MDNENIALRFEMKEDDAKDDMTEVGKRFKIFHRLSLTNILRSGKN